MSAVSPPHPVLPPVSLLKPAAPLWLATVIACLSSFMVVMDGAIVNVALPAMTADLGLSVTGRQWVVDAYLIMLGGFMLLSARLGDLYGRRRVLQIGLTLFTGASFAGGCAQGAPLLLAARAIQGLGASVLATSTLAVIVAAYPKGKARDHAIGLWTASGSVAAAGGVLAGGLLTAYASWRWVMFVNVPIGLVLMTLTALGLAALPPAGERPGIDLAGAVTVTGAAASFVYALAESVTAGWTSPAVIVALAAALVLALLFLSIEAGERQPLVRLGIFRLRNVVVGNTMLLCLGATLTASMFFLSIALHEVVGYGPRDTGLAMLPACLSIAAASIAARTLRDRGMSRLPFIGGITAAIGFFWLAALPLEAGFIRHVMGPTLLIGCGIGLMLATAVHAAIADIPQADTGLASGLLNTSRQLGGAIGIAVFVRLVQAVAVNGQSAEATTSAAQLAGYHAAFVAVGIVSVMTALASLMLRRNHA